jgi:hypothetical protein
LFAWKMFGILWGGFKFLIAIWTVVDLFFRHV